MDEKAINVLATTTANKKEEKIMDKGLYLNDERNSDALVTIFILEAFADESFIFSKLNLDDLGERKNIASLYNLYALPKPYDSKVFQMVDEKLKIKNKYCSDSTLKYIVEQAIRYNSNFLADSEENNK